MGFVNVVVLEDIGGSQTRQQSDERQGYADEGEFAYAEVEEEQHVFQRIAGTLFYGFHVLGHTVVAAAEPADA